MPLPVLQFGFSNPIFDIVIFMTLFYISYQIFLVCTQDWQLCNKSHTSSYIPDSDILPSDQTCQNIAPLAMNLLVNPTRLLEG